MRRTFSRSGLRSAALIVVFLVAAHRASAEEWHEAYRAGVKALARGDNQQAVASLLRAIALRPEPGRNVVTYGTNIEPRYFPYLRLTEAYLALEKLEAARQVLEESAKWGLEPADERHRLQARLDSALETRRPPPPAATAPPAPTPPPSTLAAPEATMPPPPPAAPSPKPSTEAIVPHPERLRAAPTPGRRVEEGSRPPSPEPSAPSIPAAEARATVEIVSQPPGAFAYLDDEPLGSTDPETGRLVKTGLRPGRHRVRVSLAGHDDALREIDVAAGGSAVFYATLTPTVPAAARGPLTGLLAFGVVALALVAVVVWMVSRRAASPAPVRSATPRPSGGATPARAPTPPGLASPGARVDELGQEWFGDYRLLEMLGRGGMASVYKAERGGEVSALKRPLGSLLDDSAFLERFLREAEIGRALNHPNIVRILARGTVDRVPYFTMELLAGQTLQAFVGSWGAAEPRTAASIVVQVAEALDFAHSKGVIHRDLKPSNIMLLADGTVKVMDFGIARATRFEGLTVTGAFLGTPDYVAPEVIEGHGAEPRSDLYSLGVVFYEILTGQRPFTGDTAFAVLKKHCAEEAPAPSAINRRIPGELDALAHRLLGKTPNDRPASAEELVVALRDWLNRAA